MPSGPVSDAARHFTAHWSRVTVTKRVDPPPDTPDGRLGCQEDDTGRLDIGAPTRAAVLLPIRPQQRVPQAPWACSQEPSWAIRLSPVSVLAPPARVRLQPASDGTEARTLQPVAPGSSLPV
ncbi:hypothetical protein I79_019405 [Cricetulus griseus]|uniref:Uncharacterized protein n=1 Tax=Cricetulus griseus TaxID=10029 RepID=G3I7B8_CRIGR|nr:hypothetical protein I79_019405 [Cricetulus griseus]